MANSPISDFWTAALSLRPPLLTLNVLDNHPSGWTTSLASHTNGRRIRQIRPYTTDQSIKSDWAPDSRHIATTENANFLHPDDSANIVTMQPDGTHVRQVTHFSNRTTNAFFGSYSPDGRWLVYRIESNGLFGLDRVHPDGTDVQTILPLSTFRPSLIDWGSSIC